MFDYAQQRIQEMLCTSCRAVLVTNGPAGVQVDEVPCAMLDLGLYLLVPRTSDHLFNLEYESTVTLLIARCELKGTARIVPRDAVDPACVLLRESAAEWCAFLHIDISRVQIRGEEGWGNHETIDL